jgi:NADH-quinone oxidoreductase subunit D
MNPQVTAKSLETEKMVLNFGPSHPATHGTLRVIRNRWRDRYKGYTRNRFSHSGFEKLGEHLDFNQYVTITDRMNYLSPLCNNVAYACLPKKLMNIDVPNVLDTSEF